MGCTFKLQTFLLALSGLKNQVYFCSVKSSFVIQTVNSHITNFSQTTMALAFSSIYSSFLILVTFLAVTNAINTNHLHSSSTSHFPKLQAEKFIRDLNLFPEANVNVAAHEPSSIPTKKSVKKRFKFPFRGISGPYIQELGHHAGYYRLSQSHTARMFYIFFESQNSKKDPVVIWLTGGPGCGSEMALFYENGPYQITKNLSLVWNDYSCVLHCPIVFPKEAIQKLKKSLLVSSNCSFLYL